MDIFEKYYFPLKSRLRSAMRGFIIALLPALDEEGSEFFDKVCLFISIHSIKGEEQSERGQIRKGRLT